MSKLNLVSPNTRDTNTGIARSFLSGMTEEEKKETIKMSKTIQSKLQHKDELSKKTPTQYQGEDVGATEAFKYLFPEAEIYGTTALKAEKEHGVKNVSISLFNPGVDDNPYKDMCFDYVIVRVVDYGEGIEKMPGYITPEIAKELFAGIVKEKGKLLYLTD